MDIDGGAILHIFSRKTLPLGKVQTKVDALGEMRRRVKEKSRS